MTRPLRLLRALLRCTAILALPGIIASVPSVPSVAASDPPAPKQGAALLKTDILGVFAHPDDETGMAATLAKYGRGEGRIIAHAYVTRGEGGGNMVGTQWGAALGILREAELRDCLRVLGVRSCHFLDQTDFFYTESLSATLRKWDKEECLRRLVRLVRSLRPEIIVTMNPAPNAGQHGHHQAAGVLAIEAFQAAADPDRFPEQLRDEGLSTWQPRKLFYGGTAGPHVVTITTTGPSIDGRSPADLAGEALAHHRSQGFGGFLNSPWLRRPQNFLLVKSVIPSTPTATDLFVNLPVPDPVPPIAPAAPPTPPALAFIPRPAITNYLHWAARHGIASLAAEFPVDRPVVAGEENVVPLLLAGRSQDWSGLLPHLNLPAGWKASEGRIVTQPSSDGTTLANYRVTPSADALSDAEITADGPVKGPGSTAKARLHPVPRATVLHMARTPPLDASGAGWDQSTTLEIGTNRTWQGKADGPADCSARVRLMHDGKTLFIDVDVLDDVVVSNIEPDDIRGHWRSDSVEICLDPAAGAEDTTETFKLGIFPFDTTGKVRAARDADARQGPVEETAPGLRLASRRTPTGYRVQAAIPLALVVNGRAAVPRRLGFNVLIYDGDKADAARGENINQCRLAWSPRSGVQGRPEDWGRIDLE